VSVLCLWWVREEDELLPLGTARTLNAPFSSAAAARTTTAWRARPLGAAADRLSSARGAEGREASLGKAATACFIVLVLLLAARCAAAPLEWASADMVRTGTWFTLGD
jgi:hypothetical protein